MTAAAAPTTITDWPLQLKFKLCVVRVTDRILSQIKNYRCAAPDGRDRMKIHLIAPVLDLRRHVGDENHAACAD